MIKKIILCIILLFSFNALAQTQQKEEGNVELPDFVITGKESVSVQKAKKIPPDFVSVISEQFVKPAFPSANLPVKEVQTPIKGSLNLIDSLNYLRGKLDAEMGFYSLPKANFEFTNPFPAGVLEAFANAGNQRAYSGIRWSQKYHIAGGANLLLFVNNQSSFLPGTEVKFHGDFGTYGYHLFGSDKPETKRTFNKGNAYVSINNTLNKYFIFSGKIKDNTAAYRDTEKFSENTLDILGSAKLTLATFGLGINVNYKKQFITNDFYNNQRYYYLFTRPTIDLKFSKDVKMSFGFNYSKIDTDFSFSPYIGFGFQLDKGITLFGEFSPKSDFYTAGHYASANPYFDAQNFTNIFYKKNSAFNVTVKYEYFTYFEIDGGIKYTSSDNFPYYTDAARKGLFDINSTQGKNFTGFVNLLFHFGPYGDFYATAEASDARDSSNNVIPYFPKAKVTLNYGYNFSFGLNAQANFEYYSKMYTNIKNTETLPSYVNMGLKFIYKWKPNFDLTLSFNNLLNKKNYLWNGYQEMPLDIAGGISITW